MREILFRAKRKDNGEWVEGYYCFFMNNHCILPQNLDTTPATLFREKKLFFLIDPDTLCQYTGLKDKNGNRIWENDVIKCNGNTLVRWNEKYAGWCLTQRKWMYEHFFGEAVRPCDCEVIGNILDIPELLEE